METLHELVARLQRAGARLWVDDGRLRIRTTHGQLPPEDVASLRRLKTEIASTLLDTPPNGLHPSKAGLRSINIAPLTYRQESLWRLMQLDQTGASRLVGSTLRLVGRVDVEALNRSFRNVVDRHEALRTMIIERDGDPLQDVASCVETPLEVVPPAQDVQSILHSLIMTPPALPIEPLFRAKLILLSPHESVLAVVAHHLITDAISMELFWSELWQLYGAYAHGSALALPKVSMQCGDYAIWQRSERFPWNTAYWQEPIHRATRIQFPTEHPARRSRTGVGAFLLLSLSSNAAQSLRDIARRENATLGSVVLTLYASLIMHECRQYEFALPFQVTGRLYAEHINMMGYFAHPLLLWIRATETDSFSQLFRRVSREFLQAQQNTDCGKLLVQSPELFSGGMFQWSSYVDILGDQSLRDVTGNGLEGTLVAEEFPFEWNIDDVVELVEHDIMLCLYESKNGVEGYAIYRKDLFTRETIRRVITDLERLCEFVAAHPQEPLSTFSLRQRT